MSQLSKIVAHRFNMSLFTKLQKHASKKECLGNIALIFLPVTIYISITIDVIVRTLILLLITGTIRCDLNRLVDNSFEEHAFGYREGKF